MNLLPHPPNVIDHARADIVERDRQLAATSHVAPEKVCALLSSEPDGLSDAEAEARLKTIGPNLIARERKPTIPAELWGRARNPLNALLLTLAAVSYLLGTCAQRG